jgi:hypothetical protein
VELGFRLMERQGHEALSLYVETFRTPVIGPTSILLLRHLNRACAAGEYVVDDEDLAHALGLNRTWPWRDSTLARTLHRLVHHKAATVPSEHEWSVASHLPPLRDSQLRRLPPGLQEMHGQVSRQP